VYLDSDRSLVVTARELHIHSNTLRQRLHRIGLLLGERWSDGRRRLDVHIALRTLQVTKAE
jgi:sugar diacid utilization regulator